MSRKMPTSEAEMLNIVGVTKANFDKYGKILVDIIEGFAAAKDGEFTALMIPMLLVSHEYGTAVYSGLHLSLRVKFVISSP